MIMDSPSSVWRSTLHSKVYFYALCLFLFSLSFSRFLLTLSLIILAVNWLFEADFKTRFTTFYNDKPALILTSIFGLSLVGVFWAEDTSDAFVALQHKLPTLLLPLIIITSPTLSRNQLRMLLAVFVGSIVLVSFIGIISMGFNPVSDFREASPFVPATSFTILLVLTVFLLPILGKQFINKPCFFWIGVIISVWLVFFMLYLRSFTGIACLFGAGFYVILYAFIKRGEKWLRWTLIITLIFFVGVGAGLFSYMYKITHTEVEVNISNLPQFTPYGHEYTHLIDQTLRENGYLVYINISDEELKEEWVQRSSLDFEGLDRNGEYVKHTLYRYMTSKGLTKDYDGFRLLTADDISNVENGFTNYLYPSWPGILRRIHSLTMGLYMYTQSGEKNPDWSTLTQRFELWKASVIAWKEKPIFGWGTGQAERAVEFGLEQIDSPMVDSWKRSHNQYLTLLLLWGIVGTIAFFALYGAFVSLSGNYKFFVFNLFLVIVLVNGLANDPIENQIGQNFFIFFSMFFYRYYSKPHQSVLTL